MSVQTVVLNNGQQAIINTDTSKIFIWDNRYDQANYTNSEYDDVTLPLGTVMGRISATQEVVPLESGASDGSQYPIGILADTRIVAAGDTIQVTYCIGGDVAEEQVILQGADTLSTVIDGRSIRDRITGDTMGIKLVRSSELTGYDNS